MKKCVTRITAGLVGTGVIASSCTGFYMADYQIVDEKLSDDGVAAIDIPLSQQNMQYLIFLDKLGKDIIQNANIAREFSENPQAYFQKYGYTESVDFDENMLNLILALGDEDINKAISLGDIKQVLALMREKGLFKLNSYNQIELTEKQKQELISTLGMDQSQQDNFVCGVAAVCVFYVAVAVVSVAAVAYTAAAGVTAVASLGVYTSVKAYGRSASIQRILDNNSVLKIWSLKGDMEKTYVATNLFIEEEINKALDAIEEINPSAFENRNARGILENIIKLNILY